jgi:hypothetical protein
MIDKRHLCLALTCATIAALLWPAEAGAIPAFARRHKLSCTTCHAPFPRLKPYGEDFAADGFALLEDDPDRDYVAAGDDLLRLNRDFPVAVRLDAFATLAEDAAGDLATDLQTPFGLKLLSGGTLARNVGYYFYFYMSEQGEVAGVEDAYVHFNDLGGKPLDVMVGQFQACDPLMKRELRLTYEDYLVYKARIGRSNVNLAYDRGVIVAWDLPGGAANLTAMVLNGNGKDPATDAGFDADRHKNFFLRAGRDVGAHASVGYFGYYGEELGFDPDPDLDAGTEDAGPVLHNRVLYHGPDLKAGNGTLDFSFQYLRRRDTNPGFLAAEERVNTDGIVAELVISPHQDRSRHVVTLLYNRIDCDWDDFDREGFTVGVSRLTRRNLRLTAEYTYDSEASTGRAALGVVSAF